MRIRFVVVVATLAATSLVSVAQVRTPSFVSADQTNAFTVLPKPPAADSWVTKEELAELHRLQTTRTKEQVERAMADDVEESIFIFAKQIGPGFNAAALPITAAFSKRVKNDEGINAAPAKKGFARIRPYNLDKTLTPVCKTKTIDDAYPSGHTTTGYLMALTLIDMVPEKRDEILARADDYANNRLVCGVHYRSDLPASRLLAYRIHAVMGTNPQYQTELAAARAELRAALKLPALVAASASAPVPAAASSTQSPNLISTTPTSK
jgi:acid phosphatase (class A)